MYSRTASVSNHSWSYSYKDAYEAPHLPFIASVEGKHILLNHFDDVLYGNHYSVIRKGTFAKYDYGWWGNLKRYRNLHPPAYDLADIPESLPLWLGYGGADALADVIDVEKTIKGLRSKPELLYIDSYGHIDFIMSVNAKDDVYEKLIMFFGSRRGPVSY